MRSGLEEWLNNYLDIQSISDSLPNGLQIEGKDGIEKIATAVSINLEVVDAAVLEGADAIVVHHGMFWNKEDPVIRGYRKKRIGKIIEHGISLFAYHLPLDLHPVISHNRLILKNLRVDEVEVPSTGTGTGSMNQDLAFGLIGIFHIPVPLRELTRRINQALKTEAKHFSFGKENVSSLFVVSGAGRNLIDSVTGLEVDTYITGDAQENTEYIAREAGLNYIYAGHYNTEKLGVMELGKEIEKKLDVEVKFIDIHNSL
jgi:dinuclear metal center YbgI/SA1388 family protein